MWLILNFNQLCINAFCVFQANGGGIFSVEKLEYEKYNRYLCSPMCGLCGRKIPMLCNCLILIPMLNLAGLEGFIRK